LRPKEDREGNYSTWPVLFVTLIMVKYIIPCTLFMLCMVTLFYRGLRATVEIRYDNGTVRQMHNKRKKQSMAGMADMGISMGFHSWL